MTELVKSQNASHTYHQTNDVSRLQSLSITNLAGLTTSVISTTSRLLEAGHDIIRQVIPISKNSLLNQAIHKTNILENKLSFASLITSGYFGLKAIERLTGIEARKKDSPLLSEDLTTIFSLGLISIGMGAKLCLKLDQSYLKKIGILTWGAGLLIDGFDLASNWDKNNTKDNLLRLLTTTLINFGRSDRELLTKARTLVKSHHSHGQKLLAGAGLLGFPHIAEAATDSIYQGHSSLLLAGFVPLVGASIAHLPRIPKYPGHQTIINRAIQLLPDSLSPRGSVDSPCAEWAGAGISYHLTEILACDPKVRTSETVVNTLLRANNSTRRNLISVQPPSLESKVAIGIIEQNAELLRRIVDENPTLNERSLRSLFYLTGMRYPDLYSFPKFGNPDFPTETTLEYMGRGSLPAFEDLIMSQISQKRKWGHPKILLLGPRDTKKDLYHSIRLLRRSSDGGSIHAYDIDDTVHNLKRKNSHLAPGEKLFTYSGDEDGNFLNLKDEQADLVLVLFPHFANKNRPIHSNPSTWIQFNEKGNLAHGGVICLVTDSLSSPANEALMGSIGMFPSFLTKPSQDWITGPGLTRKMNEKTDDFIGKINRSANLRVSIPPILWHPFQGGHQPYHTFGPLILMQNQNRV